MRLELQMVGVGKKAGADFTALQSKTLVSRENCGSSKIQSGEVHEDQRG
jgi:hypothetical protein